jgi:hypothetical protein
MLNSAKFERILVLRECLFWYIYMVSRNFDPLKHSNILQNFKDLILQFWKLITFI